ncbi:MAG: DUF2905 domain-containing protein [Ignavibacteriales bacterium]|nr:DUF2905 domain-containing protein [Ignavibacteriales bacterium]
MLPIGKILILAGGILVALGLVLVFFDKIPFLGKLPGDLHIKKNNVEIYVPFATSVLLSVMISLILWVVAYFSNKEQ